MKILNTFLVLLLSFAAEGQFAIVNDKDGIAYVKDHAAAGGKITDTLSNGHLVFILEQKNNWAISDYSKNNEQRNGFISKEQLKEIATYAFIPMMKSEPASVVLKKDSIQINLFEKPFDKFKHTYTYDSDSKKYLIKIDNREFWGTDGAMPQTTYRSIQGVIGKRKFIIPPAGLANLYEVSLQNTSANYDNEADILYIKSMNSDGAGAYYVIWKIVKGKYTERQVFYGF